MKPTEIFLSEDLKSCPETERPDLLPGVYAELRAAIRALDTSKALALTDKAEGQFNTSLAFSVALVGDNVICDRRRAGAVAQIERNNEAATK